MLHVKFQDHKTWFWGRIFLKVGHDCHLGHMTQIPRANICPTPNAIEKMSEIKAFGTDEINCSSR